MYSEEQFIELEQQERQLTDEAIILMLLILANLKGSLENELRAFYQKYGKDGVVTYAEARKWVSEQDHRRRLTALNIALSHEFDGALSKLKVEFEKMLKSVANKETGFFGVEVDTDATLNQKWGKDDSTWLKRLEDDVALWTATILMDCKLSILKRSPLNVVLGTVDNRFNSINYVMKKLGLTESTAIGSLARLKIFKELGITKYQFYTKVDERRCEECGSLHGLVFPISSYEVGVNASPIHPHCRCWEVPIVE